MRAHLEFGLVDATGAWLSVKCEVVDFEGGENKDDSCVCAEIKNDKAIYLHLLKELELFALFTVVLS